MKTPFSSLLWFIVAITMLWSKITATKTPDIITGSEGEALVQSGWWPQYTNTSLPHCEFFGITCNEFGHVTEISLTHLQDIGENFGRMNFPQIPKLESLDLDQNRLDSTIPLHLCAASKLRRLSLAGNYLWGHIPTCLGKLSELEYLDLSMNYLSGSIPSQLGSLKNLSYLFLDGNGLTGSIPSIIGQLYQLMDLRLSSNFLSGFIPSSLGKLSKLEYLDLSMNDLNGSIPSQIRSLKNLSYLSFYGNELTGSIPSTIGRLSQLMDLHLSSNHLSGFIPSCLGNLLKLTILDLSKNNLNGPIPSQLGSLKNLSYLFLDGNELTGSIPSVICQLPQLTNLDLSSNHLNDFIPSCFGNLSMLSLLDLSKNKFYGCMPSQLGNLVNLSLLNLDGNELVGSIPLTIGRLFQLTSLDLSSNHLSGLIPPTIGRLSRLMNLNLSSNHLSVFIPSCLGNLSKLSILDLSKNNLNGSIPSQLGYLEKLSTLYLFGNELTSPIPFSIWNMTNLQKMGLQENQINGTIQRQVGNMGSLRYMNLSFNRVVGGIPVEIGFVVLQSLDLRNNSLSGYIPYNIQIKYPKSAFFGNKDLIYHFSPPSNTYSSLPSNTNPFEISYKILHHKEIIIPIVLFNLSFILCLGIWLYYQKRVKPSASNEKITKSMDAFSVWNYDGRIVHEEIIKATENFDLKYCIGTGGYGSVYRVELPNGKVFAVKKLHRLEAEELTFDKSFRNEVKLLTEVRHKNIIKLHGFCLHKRCMILVYEYMERGSLFYALRNDAEALELNWSRRLNIVKDIAHAISYLHHHCSPSIIHRDLSTNNILLNNKLQAFVSDFGTARFLNPTLTNISTIAGTFGYIAPELAYTMILNEKCDVYSYGVIAMEMIMGKHPQEIISKLSTSSIEQVKLQEILDHRLPCPRNGSLITGILQVVSFALACLSPIPKLRPSMKHISNAFLNKKTVAFDNAFCEISLGQLRANYEANS